MKILTNISCADMNELARHTFAISWRHYLKKKHLETQLVAADLFTSSDCDFSGRETVFFEDLNFKLIRRGVPSTRLKDAAAASSDLKQLEENLRPLIDGYRSILLKEKPEIVLINCTYYLPWCLYIAAKKEGIKKIIVHYHGILKKEIEDYDEESKKLFLEMELSFHTDNDLVIFPSRFAKETVERDLLKRKIKNYAIIPNAIPDHFFAAKKTKGRGKNIAAVMRWSRIKNPEFLRDLADYGVKNLKPYKVNIVTRPWDIKDELYLEMKGLLNFIDPISNESLAFFYSKMDAIICPSHFETYGNVAQEALAAGTAALVSQNMGISDLYYDLGLDDWVIDFNNLKLAAEKIEKASFETVSKPLRKELHKRLNTEAVYDGLFGAVAGI